MRPAPAGRPGPVLALTQGDPAGIGPEILIKAAMAPTGPEGPAGTGPTGRLVLVVEEAALAALPPALADPARGALPRFTSPPSRSQIEALGERVALFDPVGERRTVAPGQPAAADAAGALAALDAGVGLVRAGVADALITAPVSKLGIARHCRPDFRGHTEYLAAACGLERYGRDYLMGFLAADLQVALLSTHVPLRRAVADLSASAIGEALACLARHAGGRIAVAGLNPHAGEGGLLGTEDATRVVPAVTAARAAGIDAHGPESPDSLFARARAGEFDWVLALYHDQGLIAVKTAAFGAATNWTLGLPFLRTSVDHGTAFAIAGRGLADERPLRHVLATTAALLSGELPRRRARG